MLDGVVWFMTGIGLAFWHFAYAVSHPASWLNWSDGASLMRFIYYGGSSELFFVVLVIVVALTIAGMVWNRFMWGGVRLLEGIANGVGRVVAWVGLIMVIQQVVIIFMQRIFTRAELSFGIGSTFARDISWWSEELKLWNAMIVCLCVSWTFVQGGHVRVDLLYSPASYRTKKLIDMVGALLFMLPLAVLIWMYGWYFMWRNLVNPPVSASDSLDRMLLKAKAVRWSVETIGFSPNGFDAYFLFKVLMLLFAALVFLQGVAVFWRSYLERKEGPDAEGRYLDRDLIEPGEVEMAAPEHLAREGH